MKQTRADFFRSLFLAPGAAIAAAERTKPRPANLPLIADCNDPQHDWTLAVRLNGKDCDDCFRADETRGMAWCYRRGTDGQIIYDPKTFAATREIRYGRVEIYRLSSPNQAHPFGGDQAKPYYGLGII